MSTSTTDAMSSPTGSRVTTAVPVRGRGFTGLRVLLGLLLLTTAYLKFRDANWEPFGKAVVVPHRLRTVFIESEAILGVWLLTGFAPRALWSAATLYFTALAGVSAYLAAHGAPSCGCFGQAVVNPWLTFGIDVAVVLMLGICSPRFRGLSNSIRAAEVRAAMSVAAWAMLALVAVCGAEVVRHGGATAALSAFVAQSVIARPQIAEIGEAAAGETRNFTVTLHNRSSRAIQVVGGSHNCAVDAAVDLPVMIPAGESRDVTVRGHFTGTSGPFIREYSFFTDADEGGIVTARFTGTAQATR